MDEVTFVSRASDTATWPHARRILSCDVIRRRTAMRSLRHVLWRGAVALGLFLGSSAGILVLPPLATSACTAVAATPAMAADVSLHDNAPRHRC
jgi:hypothetical protein